MTALGSRWQKAWLKHSLRFITYKRRHSGASLVG